MKLDKNSLNHKSTWSNIRIDKEVRSYILNLAVGIHDTFNRILRRELGLDKYTQRKDTKHGTKKRKLRTK